MKKLSKEILFYLIVLFMYIIFCFFIFNVNIVRSVKHVFSSSEFYFPTIIVDAGHGGVDGGAVGLNNVLEKDINLSIAKKLRDLFKANGFNVKMIRDSDISIHNNEASTIRAKKVSDLRNRLKIINSDENNLLISIHQNAFEDHNYKGAQIFFSNNNALSKELAYSIRSSISALLQRDNTREVKPSPKGVFLLNNAKVPAAIVECGFLSNWEDVTNLTDEEYQAKTAFAIFCGFVDYWRKA